MPLNMPRLALLPADVDTDAIYERFRAVLDVAPMSKTELAEEVGVSQATVSRWTAGDARPSIEKMLQAVAVVEDRLAEIQRRADEAREALEAAETALQARERYESDKSRENLEAMQDRADEVREIVGSAFDE